MFDKSSFKILIIGSAESWAIENFYVKYLKEQNIKIFRFSAQTLFYEYYGKSVLNKLIFKLGLSGIYKDVNKKLKNEVEKVNPDAIWVFKGMEIFPKSLQWAKHRNIKLINYNPDNPFIFSGKGSGNSNIKQSIELYNLHFTYDSYVKKRISDTYKIPVEILPFGFDIDDKLFERCCAQEEIVKVCFLGNPDIDRSRFIYKLAEEGIELDIYGRDWEKYINHPNIKVFEPALGENFWLVLRKYRVQLNLMRLHNPNSHNMRSFEVPGVGGIQLAPTTVDHQMYFESEKEIFLYTGVDECVDQIKKILALSETAANNIRERARYRSLQSGYTYKDRSIQAIQQIWKLYE